MSNTNCDGQHGELVFGRLSPELRNRIYDLTVAHFDAYRRTRGLVLGNIRCYNSWTRTCRQIRGETHDMFYASHSLCASADEFYREAEFRRFRALLQLLGPDIASR